MFEFLKRLTIADNSTLIALSAFSGLAGAVLTQALTALFGYLGDKRKARLELNNLYRQKQVETAENFYYVTGETMSVLKKALSIGRTGKPMVPPPPDAEIAGLQSLVESLLKSR